ncbi:hypothetical protein V1514DRAFT_303490 [Lipomyces japonicus]|uniref:uncharacterized protein n=1 Tax=Lipomyces japonicus TaxID=56871 RepID=UPI0034CE0306
MGGITSKIDDSCSVLTTNKDRFWISHLNIQSSDNRPLFQLQISEDLTTVIPITNDSSRLIEYVQDPYSKSTLPRLLKIPSSSGLLFEFKISINRAKDKFAGLKGLTFLNATSKNHLESMLTKELQSDPNIQRKENVRVIGDFLENDGDEINFDWIWAWKSPGDIDFQFNGWKNYCCFAEYNKREHRLDVLYTFEFWVDNGILIGTQIPAYNHSERRIDTQQFGPFLSTIKPVYDISDNDSRKSMVTSISKLPNNSINKALQTETATSSSAHITQGSNINQPESDLSIPEDGPLFRATIASMEKKTVSLKVIIKRLAKRAQATYEAQAQYCEAYAALLDDLRESSKQLKSLQPAAENYLNLVGRDILRLERQNCIDFQSYWVENLKRFYDVDIKNAELKKKEFEDESREYYAWLSRYLSMKQEKGKRKETDSKYQDKRRAFEIKRFDYYYFMQDLHGGRREHEVSFQLSLYVEAQVKQFLSASKSIHQAKSQIDNMVASMKRSKEEWLIRRSEREERRRALELSSMPEPQSSYVNNADQLQKRVLEEHGVATGRDALPLLTTTFSAGSYLPASPVQIKSTRDLNDRDSNAPIDTKRKEGLLWAMSRPGGHNDPRNINKSAAWHKFWVVLAGGQLCEYSNWKQQLELHNEPINLKMASVRESKSLDRRFCFEVITPQYRRVYQATSEDDMNIWIKSILNAISSTLEGDIGSSAQWFTDISSGPAGSLSVSVLKDGSNSTSTPTRKTLSIGLPKLSTSPRLLDIDGQNDLANKILNESIVEEHKEENLVKRLRETDATNAVCADCGLTSKVEWVSINLMVIICIDCGGVHRSLGTHISKVRSLTLDTVSFTPDLVDALLTVGNARANSVWEALPEAAIQKALIFTDVYENASINQNSQLNTTSLVYKRRQAFIQSKYVDKMFVVPIPRSTTALRIAVKNQDMTEVMRAIASGASASGVAMASSGASISSSSSSSSPSLSSNSSVYPLFVTALVYAPKDATTFPVAEMLVQQGANIPVEFPIEISLSQDARDFVKRKGIHKAAGSVLSPSTPSIMETVNTSAQTVKNMFDQGSKFQRKLSTGSRLYSSRHE